MIVKTAEQIREYVNTDPAATHWLRNAINSLDARDPVDALADAEYLSMWAQTKLDEVMK